MKRMGFLLMACLLFSLISCATPVDSSAVSSATGTTTTVNPTEKAYTPQTMTPPQGGDMLYPVFYAFPQEIVNSFVGYVPELIGFINENGKIIAPPQYTNFLYYKETGGRIQFIIATGNGNIDIYRVDGSLYMQLKAEYVNACNGVPYLVVVIHQQHHGLEWKNEDVYTVYDLRTRKNLLENNYNNVTLIDSHTALLQNFGPESDGDDIYEYSDSYLYDFQDPKLIKLQGIPELVEYGPPYADTITRIPATDSWKWDSDTDNARHGYLDRSGQWVKPSEENTGIKPPKDMDWEKRRAYYSQGLGETRAFEALYYWVDEGAYRGYQDKNGVWMYREDRKSHFLED